MIRLLICWMVTATLLVVAAGCGSEKETAPLEKNVDTSKVDTKELPKGQIRKKVAA